MLRTFLFNRYVSLSIALLGASSAQGADYYWNTTGGVWSSAGSWASDPAGTPVVSAPLPGDFARFTATSISGPVTANLDGPTSILGISFSNAGTTTIQASAAGTQTLSLGTRGLTMSGGAVTIGSTTNIVNVLLTGNQAWTNNSINSLSVLNGISNGGFTLTIAGSGSTTIGGTLSGTGGLLKTGAGTLTLNGSNSSTYTGGTTINGGFVGAAGATGSTLVLDFANLALPTDMINAGSALTFGGGAGGGVLNIRGQSATATSQTFNGTTLNAGTGIVTLTQNGATSVTIAMGAITRNAGGALNFSVPTNTTTLIATTSNANDAGGLLGTWATIGQTTATSYATVSAGQIVPYTAATTATTANINSTTTNYKYAAGGTLTLTTASTGGYTFQNTGAATTLAVSTANLSLNGILNSGTGGLTVSGSTLTIGANKDLVVASALAGANGVTISSIVANNGGGASSVTFTALGDGSLNATNTYSGGTFINAGRVSTNNASGFGTGLVTIASGGEAYIAAAVTVANNFSIAGFGGNSSNDTAQRGAIRLDGATVSGTVTLTGNAGFSSQATGGTISGRITGPFAISINSSGAGLGNNPITFSGTNDYSGGTIYNGLGGGAFRLGSAAALGTGTFFLSGGTLDSTVASLVLTTNNAIALGGSFSFTGTQSLHLGNGAVALGLTPTITVGASTLTFGGTVSGAFGITKAGAGTLTLAGANTYTAATTISAGTLSVGANANLGAPAANLVFDSGTLQVTGTTLGNFSGMGRTVVFNATKTVVLDINNPSAVFTVDQVLNHTTGGFTKTGAGTVNLNQANTYTGTTTINAGTLQIGSATALPAASVLSAGPAGTGMVLDLQSFNVSSPGLTIQNPTAANTLTITGSGVLAVPTVTFAGTGAFTSTILGGTINLGAGGTVDATAAAATASATRVIGSALQGSNINIRGSGNTTDTGGGNNQLTIVSGDNSALTGVVNLFGLVTFAAQNSASANTLNIAAANSGLIASGSIALANNVTLSNPAIFRTYGGAVLTLNGIVSGAGTLRTTDGGRLVLAGNNTFTGKVSIASASLSVATLNSVVGGTSASNLGAPTTIVNGTIDFGGTLAAGTLVYTGTGETTDRVVNLAGTTFGGVIDQSGTGLLKFTSSLTATGAGAKSLTLQGSTAGTGEISGVIVDNSAINTTALVKAGTGTWTLSGANTFTGGTGINAGVLLLGNSLAVQNSTVTVTAANGLQFAPAFSPFTVGGLAGAGSFALADSAAAAANLAVGNNNANTVYSGALSGPGSLTKIGAGTLTLSGANTYTGGTIVNAGVVQFNSVAAIAGTGTNLTINGNGTASFAYALDQSTLNRIDPASTGTVALATNSANTLDFSATGANLANAFLGTVGSFTYSGTLTPNGTTYRLGGGGGILTYAGNIAGSDVILGGPVIFSGTFTPSSLTINTAGNLIFNQSGPLTYASVIAGTGSITQAGTGTTTLTAVNTYTGLTNVNRGALVLDATTGGSLATSGLAFGSTGSFSYVNAASGSIQAMGVLTLASGDATITSTYGTSGTSGITFTSMSRSAGATVNFVTIGGGTSNTVAVGGVSAGFISQGTFFGGADFAFYDAGGFVRAPVYGTDPNFSTSAGGATLGINSATTHVQLTSAVTAQTTASVATLKISGATNLTLATGATLTIASGGILKTGGGTTTIAGTTTLGTLTSGAAELVIRTDTATDAVTIGGTLVNISGTSALVKSGPGTLTMPGLAQSYSGKTYLNGGVTIVTMDNLGAAPGVATPGQLTFNGGTLQTGAGIAFSVNRGILINAAGATIDTQTFASSTAAIIAGTGLLTKIGSGTLTLSGSNTYTGGTFLNAGILTLGNNSALGTGTLTLSGGAISPTANLVLLNNLVVTAATTTDVINAGAGDIAYTGSITGSGTLVINSTVSRSIWLQGDSSNFTGTINFTNTNGGTNFRLGGTGIAGNSLTTGSDYSKATFVLAGATTNSRNLSWNGLAGATVQIGSLSGVGVIGGTANGFNLQVGALNTSTIFTGIITTATGAISLTKVGTGTLTLGGANTFIGSTTINGGALELTTSLALQNSMLNASPSSIILTGLTTLNLGGLNGSTDLATVITSGYTGVITALTLNTATGVNASYSGVIPESATGMSLTKSGAGTQVLTGANTFTGATTITAGTLSVASINSVVGGTVSSSLGAPTAGNGTISIGATAAGGLTYIGTGETTDRVINLAGTTFNATLDQSGTGLLKFTSNLTATGAGAKTLVLQGSTAGTGEIAGVIVNSTGTTALTKQGTGTWTLSGANTYTGATIVNGGVLNVSGAINQTTASSDVAVGFSVAGNSVMNITGSLTAHWLYAGSAVGAAGAVNINGGSVSLGVDSEYAFTFGRNNSAYGYLNMTSGSVNTTRFQFGGNASDGAATVGTGVGLMTGGTVVNTTYMILARTGTSAGIFTITGGTIDRSAAAAGQTLGLNWDSTTGSRAELNVNGGLINNSGAGGTVNFAAGAGTGTGILNLNAGTLRTNNFTKTAGSTAYLNFNGGTLQASASSTTFLPALTAVTVNGPFSGFAGGAVLDTNGFNVTIPANLIAPTGNGVATLPLLTQGAGYIGAPRVSILGDGTGATAIANMVSDGNGALKVGSITITNPGFGYTTIPTFTLTGGGASTPATADIATLSATTSGGLTKNGAGILTLAGANTYTGQTIVNGGTLLFQTAAALGSTSGIQLGNAGAVATGTPINQAFLGLIVNPTTGGTVALAADSGNPLNFSAAGANFPNAYLGAAVNATYSGTLTPFGTTYRLGGGGGTLTYTGDITGAVNLVLGGPVIFTGTVSNTGSTTVGSGGNLIFSQPTAMTYSQVVSGSGNVSQAGSGSTTLTAASTYIGTTFVNRGTLTLDATAGGSLATSGLTFGGTGSFNFLSSAAGSTQAMGALTLSVGDGTVTSTYGTTGTSGLVFSSLTRTAGGTATFVISGGTNGTTNAITLTAQTNGFINQGSFFAGADYAFYDTTTTIPTVRAPIYNTDPNFVAVPAGATVGATTSATYVQLNGAISAQPTATVATLNITGAYNIVPSTTAQVLTIASGGLLKSGGGSSTISMATVTAGAVELVVRADTAADSLTISGNITGTGGLTKSGAGTVAITGTGTNYTGTTNINQGVLALQDTTSFVSLNPVLIGANGTLNVARTVVGFASRSAIMGNTVSGSGVININNAGTGVAGGWVIVGASTAVNGLIFTGTININSGVLSRDFTLANTISGTATVNVAAGAVFAAGRGGNSTIGALNGAGDVSTAWSGVNAGSITFGNGNASGNFTGLLHGNGNATDGNIDGGILSVIKVGTGTQILGGANTFTGTTTINGGVLQLNNTLALQSSSVTVASTNGLAFGTGFSPFTIGSLAGTSDLAITSTSATAIEIRAGSNNATTTYSGALGGPGSLTKQGTGVLTLSGTNSYTGVTTISAGRLHFSKETSLYNNTPASWTAGNIVVGNGGTLGLNIGGTGEFGTADLDILVNVGFAGGSTLALDTTNAVGTFTYATNLPNTGGSLGYAKLGTGTLVLSGANIYTGTTTIGGGTLSVAAISDTGTSNIGTGPITFTGGSLIYTAVGASVTTNRGATTTAAGTITIADAGTTLSLTTGFTASASTFAMTKAGAGTLELLGSTDNSSLVVNVQAGALNLGKTANAVRAVAGIADIAPGATVKLVGSGTDQIYGGSASGSPGLVNMSGGTLDLNNHSESIDRLTGSGTVTSTTAGAITFTLGETGGSGTFSGSILNGSGTITLAKTGAGTAVLSGTNTYTGGTTITGGVLQFNTVASIGGTGANITLGNSGTMAAGYAIDQAFVARIANPTTTGTVALAAASGNNLDFNSSGLTGAFLGASAASTFSGTLTPNGNTFRLGGGGAALTVSSILSGATNNLIVAGPRVILTGANTYAGTTTINAGATLQIGAGGAAGTLGTGTGTVVNNGTLAYYRNDATATYSGTMTGTGVLTVAQGGTLTLASGASVAVGSLNAGDGTGSGLGAGTFNILPGAALTVAGMFLMGNQASQNGNVNQSGGTVTLNTTTVVSATAGDFRIGHWATETSTYTLTGGTLNALGADTTLSWDGNGTLSISGGTANLRGLRFNRSTATTTGILNLSGGTLNIGTGGIYDGSTGANVITVNISGGTLGALAPWTGSVPMVLTNAPVVDTTGGNITLSGILSSTGSLNAQGANTLILSGVNTFSGGLNIRSGTVSGTTSAAAFGTGTITLGNTSGTANATLNGGGALTFTNLIAVAAGNTGTASITSTANAIFSGAVTLSSHDVFLTPATATTLSINGGITGSGSVWKSGAGTATFSTVASTYTGTTNLINGALSSGLVTSTLNLAFSAGVATNLLPGTSALALGGALATPVQTLLGGANLTLTGAASTTNSQSFGSATIGVGGNSITLTANATANPLSLNLGTLNRTVGGTLNITQPTGTLSATNGVQTPTGTASTILTINGTAFATVGTNDWAAKDATNGFIVGLSTIAGGYTASNSGATFSGNANVTGTFAANSDSTVNSIRMNTAFTLTLAGTNTISTGGILMGSASTITGGTMIAGTGRELVFMNSGGITATINSAIADSISGSSSVTYRGVTLTTTAGQFSIGSNNTYTGNTYINSMRVGSVLASPFGTGAVYINGNTHGQYWKNTTANVTANNFFIVGNGWVESGTFGAIRLDAGSISGNVTLTGDAAIASHSGPGLISGTVSGTGFTFTKLGSSTLTLTGANSYGATAISAGTLQIGNAGTSGTLGTGDVTLAASTALTFIRSDSPIVPNKITSPTNGTVTWTGAGTLSLNNAANTFGTLLISTNGGIIDVGSGTTTVNAAGLNGIRYTGTGGTGTVNATGGGTIVIGPSDDWGASGTGGTLVVNAKLTGIAANTFEAYNGGIVSTMVLTAANTFAGNVAINAGTLSVANIGNQGSLTSNLGSGTTISISGAANVSVLKYTGTGETTDRIINLSNATLGGAIDQSGTGNLKFTTSFTAGGAGIKALTLTGSTAGTGEIAGAIPNNSAANTTGIIKSGTGTWILSGTSPYTGPTTIGSGTLSVAVLDVGGVNSSIGASTNAAANLVFSGNSTLQYTGATAVSDRAFTINTGVTASINVSLAGNNLTLAGATGAATTGGLTKLGSGTLTLTGANTYTGNTAVSAGELRLAATASLASGSAVAVSGTLGGTGTIGGATTVLTGGTLRGDSGTGTGTITSNANVTVQSGGNFAATIGATGTNSSLALGANTIDLNTGSNVALIGVLGFSRTQTGPWILATSTNGITQDTVLQSSGAIFGTFTADGLGSGINSGPVNIRIDSLGTGLLAGDQFTLSQSGTNLVLNYAAVPESGTLLGLAAAGLGFARWMRSRRRNKA